jgi:hypothetical protein
MILGDCIIFGDSNGIFCTLTVNTLPGAFVSAALGNKVVSATTNASGVAVLTLKKEGLWTVTATKEDFSKSAVVDITYNIDEDLTLANPTFANNSWSTISKIAKAGLASTMWNIGDTKTLTIGGETYTAQIVDFDQYDVADSASYGRAKAGITFHLTETLAESRAMNSATTVGGGWGESTLRTYCNGELLTSLDSTLQGAIATVLTPYTAGKTTAVSTIEDKIFIPSEYEMFGLVDDGYAAEGGYFDYYASGKTIKKNSHGTTIPTNYWTRTVYKGNGTLFVTVSSSGAISGFSPANKTGVCPVFCV